jgi:hypothetical protein
MRFLRGCMNKQQIKKSELEDLDCSRSGFANKSSSAAG